MLSQRKLNAPFSQLCTITSNLQIRVQALSQTCSTLTFSHSILSQLTTHPNKYDINQKPDKAYTICYTCYFSNMQAYLSSS